MVKHGLSPEEAAARFWVLDHNGLITTQVRSQSSWAAPRPLLFEFFSSGRALAAAGRCGALHGM